MQQYDYFYGTQAEQFSFYRIPKALFTEPTLREMSTDAKVLYGIQRQKFFLNQSDVQRYFPDTYTPEQMQNVIFHLLRSWEHKRTSRHRPQREDELER